MKLNIEIEVPDDIEPCCIHSCATYCPFGYYDGDDMEERCNHMTTNDNGNWECIVSKAMKKHDEEK